MPFDDFYALNRRISGAFDFWVARDLRPGLNGLRRPQTLSPRRSGWMRVSPKAMRSTTSSSSSGGGYCQLAPVIAASISRSGAFPLKPFVRSIARFNSRMRLRYRCRH
jgi:hypothetical protein